MFRKISALRHSVFFIVIILVAPELSPALAEAFQTQTSSTPDRIIPIPHPITILLRHPSIHQKLDLREHQITSLEKTIDTVELELFSIRDLPLQPRQSKAAALIRKLQRKLEATLSTIQQNRLRQYVWRSLGIYAIQEPDLQSQINLTSTQKQKIQSIFQTLTHKMIAASQPNPDNPDADPLTQSQNLIAQTEKDIQASLTENQRSLLSKVLGEKLDLNQFRNLACKAPEIQPVENWLNSSPLTLAKLKGKVVVVHFYAFACLNCKRNLPYYNQWSKDYPPDKFQIIGIHHPEIAAEHDLKKVKQNAARAQMNYPIVIDSNSLNWNAWTNQIWPSIYLIDKQGFIRFWWYGELNFQGAPTEKLFRTRIRQLLVEKQPLPHLIP